MSLPSLKNLDKSSWQKLPFGEIAQSIGERVDPTKTDLETYVGLEHIDPESIHIKRFGKREDVSGTKLRCYPGDVIFGRRRAYQRKAAICEFDGFCSAHSLVLRAIPEVIDPKLFPFFLHSDQFMHRAVDISVGGLSPTINWTKLKKEEFLLPPKDQQAKLAELLWASDEMLQLKHDLGKQLHDSAQALFYNEIFEPTDELDKHFGHFKPKHEVVKVGDHIELLQYGISESLDEAVGIPVLRMNNLQNGKLDLTDLKYLDVAMSDLEGIILEKGDVLFNRTNSFDLVGKVSLFDSDLTCSFASYLLRIKTNIATLDPRYLNFFFNSELGKSKIRKYRTPGVSQSNINAQNIRLIRMPLPSIELQHELMQRLSKMEEAEVSGSQESTIAKQLLKSLINEIF